MMRHPEPLRRRLGKADRALCGDEDLPRIRLPRHLRAGTTGIDDEFAQRLLRRHRSRDHGRRKVRLSCLPHDDPDWRGWWGETPPFGYPVFVLTHREVAPIEMLGGTTFHFINASPTEALAIATDAAAGADVRIGGRPTSLRPYLTAGLVDELHVDHADRARSRNFAVG